MALPYDSLPTETKLALVQQTPPRAGESKEAWYARAIAGAEPQPGGPPPRYTQATLATGAQRPIPARAAGPGVETIQPTPAVGVAALPAALAAALGAIGVSGGALAALGGLYGVAQVAGVQFPWETGPGEGFIAPWTREIVQSEQGRWVTRETRPELFPNGVSTARVPAGGQVTVSVPAARGVVKTWDTGYTMPDGTRVPGWPFAMTSDADGKHKRIHTVNKDGVPVSWTPYRSIVIGKTLKTSDVRRVASRINSHVKSLKKVLNILK